MNPSANVSRPIFASLGSISHSFDLSSGDIAASSFNPDLTEIERNINNLAYTLNIQILLQIYDISQSFFHCQESSMIPGI